jgi:short-subunit dehydrogenase involved in D-alanine esterification of teichoic acids
MIIKDKTILITGGSTGIGLEAARQFLAEGATVIITGRSQKKLDAARNMYPALIAIQSDVAHEDEAKSLLQQVEKLGGIDMLYNNAGVLTAPLNLGIASDRHFDDAAYEMNVNYLGVIRLNNLFLNMLKSRKESAIINTTSLLSYVPSVLEATYAASKVALHFYTESLRKHLQILDSPVKVFELVPPVIATEMTADRTGKKMTPDQFVSDFIRGLKRNKLTIRIGDTNVVYILNRLFPKLTSTLVNPRTSYPLLQP